MFSVLDTCLLSIRCQLHQVQNNKICGQATSGYPGLSTSIDSTRRVTNILKCEEGSRKLNYHLSCGLPWAGLVLLITSISFIVSVWLLEMLIPPEISGPVTLTLPPNSKETLLV